MQSEFEPVIKEHYDAARKFLKDNNRNDDILGVFLYGSQNYNLADEQSDVDTICIIVPSIETLCFKKPLSEELVLPSGEHCILRDIRKAIQTFAKMNVDDMQLLYTKHCIVNERYKDTWDNLISQREKIVNSNKQQTVKTVFYGLKNVLKKITEEPKKLISCIRWDYFLDNYGSGMGYEQIISIPETLIIASQEITRDELMRIKRLKSRKDDATYRRLMDYIVSKYRDADCPVIEQNEADIEAANRILNTFLIESVKRYVKNGETSD